jgi:hypothetical protein
MERQFDTSSDEEKRKTQAIEKNEGESIINESPLKLI